MTRSRKRKATAPLAKEPRCYLTIIAPEIRNRILRYLLIEDDEKIIAKPLHRRVTPYEPLSDRQQSEEEEEEDDDEQYGGSQGHSKRRKIEAKPQRRLAPFPTFAPSNMVKHSALDEKYEKWLSANPRSLYKAQQAYGIFVACKQLYTEATTMFFGTHTFSGETLPDLLAFLDSIGSQIALIRQVRIPDLEDDYDEDVHDSPVRKQYDLYPEKVKMKDGGNGLVLNDIIRRLHRASKIEEVSIPVRRFGAPACWWDSDDAVDWYWQDDTSSPNQVELLPFLELQKARGVQRPLQFKLDMEDHPDTRPLFIIEPMPSRADRHWQVDAFSHGYEIFMHAQCGSQDETEDKSIDGDGEIAIDYFDPTFEEGWQSLVHKWFNFGLLVMEKPFSAQAGFSPGVDPLYRRAVEFQNVQRRSTGMSKYLINGQ